MIAINSYPTYTMLLSMCYRDLQSVHVARTLGSCLQQMTVPGSPAGSVEKRIDRAVQHATTCLKCPNDLAHWVIINIHHWVTHARQPASSMSLYHDLQHWLLVLHKPIINCIKQSNYKIILNFNQLKFNRSY